MKDRKTPELLAPAGSYSAFLSAISHGADAVYMGGAKHNARIGAQNFTDDELARAIDTAHAYGKKVYITLNTLVDDRELFGVLDYVEGLLKVGADAFIVQDIGLIKAISAVFPEAELHASTQCITHSLDGIKALCDMGVKRAVLARELDRDNISRICLGSPIETEVFVHGALCVCHSGACLFSSLVGGRSGNRGECAQPCRLPYRFSGFDGEYPLSLSDLTLSEHLTDLAEMGVSSLKIEGRMKSEAYVGGVVGIFRELLDMGRDATKSDVERLARIFSRGGFTDGYYTGRIGRKMYGVRSAEDKQTTRELECETVALPKIPLDATMTVTADGAELVFSTREKSATAKSAPLDTAINRPLDEASAREQIAKLGDTPFVLNKFDFSTEGSYIVPKSVLNALRREALEGLKDRKEPERRALDKVLGVSARPYEKYLVYAPHRRDTVEPEGFDRVYFPLFRVPERVTERTGVLLPVIITDTEREEVREALLSLKDKGVKYAYAESISAATLAISLGFLTLGGARMNAYNSYTLMALQDMGLEGVLMSSELVPAAKRDLKKLLPVGEVIWGRAPLMIMENCIMNERDNCRDCSDFKTCRKSTSLVDRKGIAFPTYPEFFHRCQIYNSVPTSNADRKTPGASFGVVFITDEKDVTKTIKQICDGVLREEYTRKG